MTQDKFTVQTLCHCIWLTIGLIVLSLLLTSTFWTIYFTVDGVTHTYTAGKP